MAKKIYLGSGAILIVEGLLEKTASALLQRGGLVRSRRFLACCILMQCYCYTIKLKSRELCLLTDIHFE